MLSIRHIEKQYAGHKALTDISLEVEKGQVFGLLGPNGAGKTSLIRIINQITAPDSGEVYFDGEKLNPSHIERIGYMPEERGLYKKMEIGEQMIYLARLKGLSRAEAQRRLKIWFEKLGMETWWKKKIEELSKGMQQKAQFVATVLHEPDLIILDEPFSGFDPVNAELIKDEILELNKKGATILFSTHRMESVEELCDAIALIHLSHKILDGKIKTIKNAYRNDTYLVEYIGKRVDADEKHPFQVIDEIAGEDNSYTIRVKLDTEKNSNDILQYLLPKVHINMLKEVIPSMNEIFIEQVNKKISLTMNKVFLIIQREYITRVRKKAFIIMIFAVPTLILVMFGAIVLVAKNNSELGSLQTVKVLDETGIFAGKFHDGKNISFQSASQSLKALKYEVLKDENMAILRITSGYSKKDSVQIYSKKKPSFILTGEIEKQMNDIAVSDGMLKHHIDTAVISSIKKINISVNSIQVTETGDKNANVGANMGIGIACAIFIYMALFIYGAQVMRGVIEEKTSRIIEVIISSVKPFQLMLGKIIGVGLVGLTQFAAWMHLVLPGNKNCWSCIFCSAKRCNRVC